MEKEFTGYIIAEKAAKLGFNEPCIALYDENKKLVALEQSRVDRKFSVYTNHVILSEAITAPLWQQVEQWLLEKHGLYVAPFAVFRGKEIAFYKAEIAILNTPLDTQDLFGVMKDSWDTLDQAREAAILKALELITK